MTYHAFLDLPAPDAVRERLLGAGITDEETVTLVCNAAQIAGDLQTEGHEPSELPPVGQGTVFEKRQHNRALVAGLLGFLLLTLYGLLKLELGARIVALGGGPSEIERTV